jgi:hypothetical protein
MCKTIRPALIAALLLICFGSASCARAARTAATPPAVHFVVIDGLNVPALTGNLLSLLEPRVDARLRLTAGPVEEQPLVVVDDVPLVDGTKALREISVRDVARVTTLPPMNAFRRYGRRGYHGAIIVETVQK